MPPAGHYSIGEVLSLLQADFPDITISKIRFLESQGLIDPERTPSGYRRFLDHDLERLRWILVQQRDHYLPLKVIRERLDAGEPFTDPPPPPPGTGHTTVAETTAETGGDAGGNDAPPPSAPPLAEPEAAAPPLEHRPPRRIAPVAPSARRRQPPAAERSEGSDQGLGAPAGQQLPDQEVAGAEPATPTPDAPQPPGPEAGTQPDRPEPTPDPVPTPADEAPATAGRPPSDAAGDSGTSVTPPAGPPGGNGRPSLVRPRDTGRGDGTAPALGAMPIADPLAAPPGEEELTLTRDELSRASGCSVQVLHDLERFGLLQGRSSGSSMIYDQSSLAVAKLASRFAAHGLEPRHLRSFRLAADREVGLFAQVVGPMLQRRDPAVQQQAVQAVAELVELAAELHRVLLHDVATAELGPR